MRRNTKFSVAVALVVGVVGVTKLGVADRLGSAPASAAAPATGCTWYVSPAGSVRSGGRSASRATTLRNASRHAGPGDVICVGHGVYRLSLPLRVNRSGTDSSWIVYRSYNGRALIVPRVRMEAALIEVRQNTAYVEFRGLSFDGGGANAYEAYHLEPRSHHIRVVDNVITSMGAAGIITSNADYVTFTGNRIARFGDGVGWSSGISLNDGGGEGPYWYDSSQAFHNVIANNVITGGVDNSYHHTDGNGIILDLGGQTPPVLVANNLVYQNGGRCIHVFHVRHAWVINNTCYMNGLDSRVGASGELTSYDAQDVHVINNVAVAWSGRPAYRVEAGSSVSFSHNVAWGGLSPLLPAALLGDPSALLVRDPRFVDAIQLDPVGDGQWTSPITPALAIPRFRPRAASILRTAGADPRTQPGVTPALLPGIQSVLARDLLGQKRWTDGRFSIGAYDS